MPSGVFKVTAAVDPAAMCYWKITKTGHPDSIISNDIVNGGTPSVTLQAGLDFTTQDCEYLGQASKTSPGQGRSLFCCDGGIRS